MGNSQSGNRGATGSMKEALSCESVLLEVLSNLPGRNLAQASLCCVSWCEAANGENRWALLALQELKINQRIVPTWRRTYSEYALDRFDEMSSQQDPDRVLKLVLLGDSVGKSAFVERWTNDVWVYPKATIGVELSEKTVKCAGTVAKIQLLDVAAPKPRGDVTRAHYRRADGFFLVYSIVDEESFELVRLWLLDLLEEMTAHSVIGLMGCQCDLERKRLVSSERGAALAAEIAGIRGGHVWFTETSAKTAHGVEKTMVRMTRNILRQTQ